MFYHNEDDYDDDGFMMMVYLNSDDTYLRI